jgi:hypothetical protein
MGESMGTDNPGLSEEDVAPNSIKEIGVIKDMQIKTLARIEEVFQSLNGDLSKRGLLARMECSEKSLVVCTRAVVILCGIVGIEGLYCIWKLL